MAKGYFINKEELEIICEALEGHIQGIESEMRTDIDDPADKERKTKKDRAQELLNDLRSEFESY